MCGKKEVKQVGKAEWKKSNEQRKWITKHATQG